MLHANRDCRAEIRQPVGRKVDGSHDRHGRCPRYAECRCHDAGNLLRRNKQRSGRRFISGHLAATETQAGASICSLRATLLAAGAWLPTGLLRGRGLTAGPARPEADAGATGHENLHRFPASLLSGWAVGFRPIRPGRSSSGPVQEQVNDCPGYLTDGDPRRPKRLLRARHRPSIARSRQPTGRPALQRAP